MPPSLEHRYSLIYMPLFPTNMLNMALEYVLADHAGNLRFI